MPQTDQSLLLDLANSFSGDTHESPDLLQGHRLLIIQTEVQAKNLGLPLLQRRKRFLHALFEGVVVRLVLRARRVLVGQVVEQSVVFAGRDRSVQREMRLRDRQRSLDLHLGYFEIISDFLDRGLTAQLL